jgi:hypothetical protein
MVYHIDSERPIRPQTVYAVERSLTRNRYDYLVVLSSNPLVAMDFLFPGLKTILVTESNLEEVSPAVLEALNAKGIIVIKSINVLRETLHPTSGKLRSMFRSEMMASTINSLEESIKKCLEAAVTVVDKGIIEPMTPVIAVAGHNSEPDTAIVVEPAISGNILDSRIVRLICHPCQDQF